MRRTISNLLIIVLSAIIAFSGFRLWRIFHEYHVEERQYSETASRYTRSQTADRSPADDDAEVCPITVDFDGLKAINPEVVGWIYSADTRINYPVLRGVDNDKYLHQMINGQENPAGSVFMDCRSSADLSNLNTIIYGHHMKNGSMFASLHEYTEQAFYDAHKYMWYLTPEHTYRLDVLYGYVGEAEAPVYTVFTERDELDAYLTWADIQSTFVPAKIPQDIDGIVVLSTCSYEYDNARFVIVTVPVMVD